MHDVLHRLMYEFAPVVLVAIVAGVVVSHCIHTAALHKEPTPGPSVEVPQ